MNTPSAYDCVSKCPVRKRQDYEIRFLNGVIDSLRRRVDELEAELGKRKAKNGPRVK